MPAAVALGADAHRTNVAVNCLTPPFFADHFVARMRDRRHGAIAAGGSPNAATGGHFDDEHVLAWCACAARQPG